MYITSENSVNSVALSYRNELVLSTLAQFENYLVAAETEVRTSD
jgi:hypothetical protein